MNETKKKNERSKAKLKEVNEQELQRVMGGSLGCSECLCGSGSATQSEACTC